MKHTPKPPEVGTSRTRAYKISARAGSEPVVTPEPWSTAGIKAERDRLRALNSELVAAMQAIAPMFSNDTALLSVYKDEIEQFTAVLAKAKP